MCILNATKERHGTRGTKKPGWQSSDQLSVNLLDFFVLFVFLFLVIAIANIFVPQSPHCKSQVAQVGPTEDGIEEGFEVRFATRPRTQATRSCFSLVIRIEAVKGRSKSQELDKTVT